MKTRLAAVLLAAMASGGAHACDPGLGNEEVERLESARYRLAFRSEPAEITVGRHFALELAVCAKNGAPLPESVRVDAHMPAHRHGMNYAPSTERVGSARWRAHGLLLHMPGDWEFRFDLRAAGDTDRLTHRQQLN